MSLWKPARVLPFCLAMGALILFPLGIAGGGAAPAGAESEPPINITSDQMEYLSEENVVIFIGNALAVREDMTISADKMEVTLADENSDGKDEGSVRLIVATGSVNVRQVVPPTGEDKAPKERFATGERGEYDGVARTVTLTGSPRLWEGKNIVTGEKMIFHIDDQRFVVKGKVGLSIFPEKGMEKK